MISYSFSPKDELANLRAEHEFKSHYLQEKDKEITSLTQTLTTIQTENEVLHYHMIVCWLRPWAWF